MDTVDGGLGGGRGREESTVSRIIAVVDLPSWRAEKPVLSEFCLNFYSCFTELV